MVIWELVYLTPQASVCKCEIYLPVYLADTYFNTTATIPYAALYSMFASTDADTETLTVNYAKGQWPIVVKDSQVTSS